ncbi:MAG: hypothetical protein GC162_03245 [Planctomycetes bacterium]|nr:hypothetical protein [Planctomycetota bacterium]
MIVICLSLIVLAFIIACPLTGVMRKVGVKLGQMDAPGERKLHTTPIPATGGVAVFWGVVGPIVAGLVLVHVVPIGVWDEIAPALVKHLPGIGNRTMMAGALVACLAVLHITGLVDDRKNLGPFLKLGIQAGAAATMAIFFDVRLLELLGPVPSILATIVWLIVITNAFNFLDNMDGLSAGVATICAAILLAAALISGQWFVAAVLALLIGALLGFLVFNFPPAKIFMGDGGSLVVGFLMGISAVRVTYYDPQLGSAWWAVFTPAIVLAIPLYDFLSVTILRIAQGKSPFVGDTQHFSHRLVRKGLTRPAAVMVVWACTLATGLGGVMIGRVASWQAALIVAQTAAILLVLALLERTGNKP